MPGIVGLITHRNAGWATAQLTRMMETMRHESSYNSYVHTDESLGVYVGSISRRGSFADAPPAQNERADVTLIFSGEEFSEPEIAAELRHRGHTFTNQAPSYLVHLYEDDDAAFAGRLNGRFHGLIADRRNGTAMLFNDRFGMHRIYYHESSEAFYFAAEAKAILEVCPELRVADPQALGEFISCGCVLENRTYFKGIQVVPPASSWVFRGGALEGKGIYFRREEWENQEPLEPEVYYQSVREVFTRNLPRYFSGNQTVGMSLTGGLDTRMIMAWYKSPPGALPCYSFGGMFRDCQDVVLARQVARACEQSHDVIPVGSQFLSRFSHYAERTVYLSDGCVDVTFSPDLYANEQAASIAPVRITGNYGGEVLRRVRAFKPVKPTLDVFRPELMAQVNRANDTYASLLHGHPLSFAVFRQAPWHHYGLLALEETQLSLRSPYLDNDFVRTVFRAPQSALKDNNVCLRLIAEGDPNLQKIPTDRGLAGDLAGLPAAMSRGFLEFTFKAEYAYDYGMPQWMARIDHLLSPLRLERLFLGRHKFKHFRVWYRDALSKYIREILLDTRTLSRPYLHRQTVEGLVRGHLKGNQNYTSTIHKLLTLELMHRRFVDAK